MIRTSTLSRRLLITEILLETFAPPRIATNGLSGLFTAFPRKSISFFLHQITNYCCINKLCYANIGAVCSVSSTECVVYEYIAERSKLFAEFFSVFCLLCTITCIFKKNYFSVIHCFYCSFCVWSYYFRISSKFYFLSKKLGKTYCYRSK